MQGGTYSLPHVLHNGAYNPQPTLRHQRAVVVAEIEGQSLRKPAEDLAQVEFEEYTRLQYFAL